MKRAFSLVECLIAIAVSAFVLVSLIGLMTLNLRNDGDSQNEVDASNIMSMLLSARRILPMDQPALALPSLTSLQPGAELKETMYIDSYGLESSHQERFNLYYEIRREERLIDLYRLKLKLIWPATPNQEKHVANELEVSTTIRLNNLSESKR